MPCESFPSRSRRMPFAGHGGQHSTSKDSRDSLSRAHAIARKRTARRIASVEPSPLPADATAYSADAADCVTSATNAPAVASAGRRMQSTRQRTGRETPLALSQRGEREEHRHEALQRFHLNYVTSVHFPFLRTHRSIVALAGRGLTRFPKKCGEIFQDIETAQLILLLDMLRLRGKGEAIRPCRSSACPARSARVRHTG